MPFLLYPGEEVDRVPNFMSSGNYSSGIRALPVIVANHGLLLEARVDHTAPGQVHRSAGDRWTVEGPATYMPSPNVVSSSAKFKFIH